MLLYFKIFSGSFANLFWAKTIDLYCSRPCFFVVINTFVGTAVLRRRQLIFDHVKVTSGKFVKLHFSLPNSGVLKGIYGFLADGVFVNSSSNMGRFVGTSK